MESKDGGEDNFTPECNNDNVMVIDDKDESKESKNCDSSEEETVDIPDDYLFSSFFVFVIWGPYVEADKCLDVNLMNNKKKI